MPSEGHVRFRLRSRWATKSGNLLSWRETLLALGEYGRAGRLRASPGLSRKLDAPGRGPRSRMALLRFRSDSGLRCRGASRGGPHPGLLRQPPLHRLGDGPPVREPIRVALGLGGDARSVLRGPGNARNGCRRARDVGAAARRIPFPTRLVGPVRTTRSCEGVAHCERLDAHRPGIERGTSVATGTAGLRDQLARASSHPRALCTPRGTQA